MKQPVVLNDEYILRVYANNAILFSKGKGRNDRILNRFEKEIIDCVDGEKNRNELIHALCKLYSIANMSELDSEYQVISRYVDSFLEEGILVYD